jgi:SAM-dependent methyltransferase
MTNLIYPSAINSPRVRSVMALAKKHKAIAETFVDLGCGNGSIAADLGRLLSCRDVIGIEIESEPVNIALREGRISKGFCLDIGKDSLPLPDISVDFVYAGEVIEHLYDPDHLLDEIYRILKPDGIAIIDTPNLASWFNRISLLLGYQPFLTEVSLRYNVGKLRTFGPSEGQHIRVFTSKAFSTLIKLHHFKIKEFRGIPAADPVYTPLSIPLRALERLFAYSTSLAGASICVVIKQNEKPPYHDN